MKRDERFFSDLHCVFATELEWESASSFFCCWVFVADDLNDVLGLIKVAVALLLAEPYPTFCTFLRPPTWEFWSATSD